MPESWTPPDWVYTEGRPETDREYFINLTRVIFQAGMSWKVIAAKWSGFGEVFDDFDVEKIADYGPDDVKRLRGDTRIIRNRQKIQATVLNADEFLKIKGEHGSFQQWLDSLDKSNNYDYVVKRLSSRLKRVGKSSAHIFLWSVGEPITWDEAVHKRRPTVVV